jgi:hypothetical protein
MHRVDDSAGDVQGPDRLSRTRGQAIAIFGSILTTSSSRRALYRLMLIRKRGQNRFEIRDSTRGTGGGTP